MKYETIRSLLPDVMRRADAAGTPLRALLEAQSACLDPVDETLLHIADIFSARRAPDEFVGMIANWVDLGDLLVQVKHEDQTIATSPAGHGRLREFIAFAAELARWRGTAYALQRCLEVAVGLRGIQIEESPDQPFWFGLHLPATAREHAVWIEKIVSREKPVFVQCTITYDIDEDTSDATVNP